MDGGVSTMDGEVSAMDGGVGAMDGEVSAICRAQPSNPFLKCLVLQGPVTRSWITLGH